MFSFINIWNVMYKNTKKNETINLLKSIQHMMTIIDNSIPDKTFDIDNVQNLLDEIVDFETRYKTYKIYIYFLQY